MLGTLTCKIFFARDCGIFHVSKGGKRFITKKIDEYRKESYEKFGVSVFFSPRNGLEWRWIKRLEPMMAACSVCATSLVRIATGFLPKQPNWKLLKSDTLEQSVGHS